MRDTCECACHAPSLALTLGFSGTCFALWNLSKRGMSIRAGFLSLLRTLPPDGEAWDHLLDTGGPGESHTDRQTCE